LKVAVLRNTTEAEVLNRFGRPNREYYRESDIEAVAEVLDSTGHQTEIIEADVDLISSLERFFGPRRTAIYDQAMVFNLAYGLQGESRYTHVPAMLEMAGIPYVGSSPGAHAVCLDKYLAKMVFERAGLPTPGFQLFRAGSEKLRPELSFPLIVKPQSESTSFGIKVVRSAEQLRGAVAVIAEEFQQPALLEEFIDGLEVNCGVLGNSPPEALPPLEIDFGNATGDQAILSFEVKRDRTASHVCPARLDEKMTRRIQELAVAAFQCLECRDAARVDFRIDRAGNPYILEINSMVAIHQDGSFFCAAKTRGLSYQQMITKVFDAARARIMENI
jgi:D-alanine-D-alanine ligase